MSTPTPTPDIVKHLETVVPTLSKVTPILDGVVPRLEKFVDQFPVLLGGIDTRIKTLEKKLDALYMMHQNTAVQLVELHASVMNLIAAMHAKISTPESPPTA